MAPEGKLWWQFDFADVQPGDEVLDEALLEDDGDEGCFGVSGAHADDYVGGAKMGDTKDGAQVSLFIADGGDRLDLELTACRFFGTG